MTNINKPAKPLSVAREEFCKDLFELINKSGLPAVVIQPIIAEFNTMVANAAKEQYEKEALAYKEEMAKYEKAKAEENKNEVSDAEGVQPEA